MWPGCGRLGRDAVCTGMGRVAGMRRVTRVGRVAGMRRVTRVGRVAGVRRVARVRHVAGTRERPHTQSSLDRKMEYLDPSADGPVLGGRGMLPAVEPVNLENAPALTNAFSSVELRASERRRSSGLLCRARKAFRLWATPPEQSGNLWHQHNYLQLRATCAVAECCGRWEDLFFADAESLWLTVVFAVEFGGRLGKLFRGRRLRFGNSCLLLESLHDRLEELFFIAAADFPHWARPLSSSPVAFSSSMRFVPCSLSLAFTHRSISLSIGFSDDRPDRPSASISSRSSSRLFFKILL